MNEVLTGTVAALTAVTLAAGMVGFGVKYALLPWLRANLVKPVEETHHQVTVNAHASPEPTVLDKLDTLARNQEDFAADLQTLATVLENHIEFTQENQQS